MRLSNNGRLRHRRMPHQRGLQLHRAQPVLTEDDELLHGFSFATHCDQF